MYGDDDFVPDENDKVFDEMAKMVEFAKGSLQLREDPNHKFDVNSVMIEFMMEEVPSQDIRIYQQDGGSWIAEVKYHGINFICVAGKILPDSWEEFFDNLWSGEDDNDEDDNDDGFNISDRNN